MIALITGGSGSGKSAWAENLSVLLEPNIKYYIATMQPFGKESEVRIARHRAMRADKGFSTLECPLYLDVPPVGSTVLLECMSNLMANVMFSPHPPENCVEQIWQELSKLMDTCRHLLLVSNEVFSDGERYDPDTLCYLSHLGALNCRIASRADLVVEVVCGLPLVLKGEVPC